MLQKFDDRFRYKSLQLRYKDKSRLIWLYSLKWNVYYKTIFLGQIYQIFKSFIGASELRQNIRRLETQVQYAMSQLARQVKRRDKHRHRRERQYNLITAILQASSPKRSKLKVLSTYILVHNASLPSKLQSFGKWVLK